ncbi:hypothetical protein [Solilutibacter silvestris]|uniref:hypothetical protein n=1 Tax=Solilutibacter silvestris TaxID=1645665 RepID=UPI003D349C06
MRSERACLFVLAVIVMAGCQRAPEPAPQAETNRQAINRVHERDQRERQSAWLQLDEAQRQRIRDAATAFAALPADEQSRFRAEFAQLDRAEQRGWLLGPQVGALWPQLSPLLSYVPEDERAPLLRILHDMNADELAELGRIAWRTPPEQRDALRKELMNVPAANRAAWLAQVSER